MCVVAAFGVAYFKTMSANLAISSGLGNGYVDLAKSIVESEQKAAIQTFRNPLFGEIRVSINNQGEPMFCLVDVCRALEIKNTSDVKSRLKQDGVGTNEVIDNLGRTQQATFITESNLYKCIFQSRVEKAEQFQDWVCEDVLPTIRKTGNYSIMVPKTFSQALRLAAEQAAQIEAQQQIIATQATAINEMQPKVSYCDIILQSPSTILVTQIAQDYGKSAKAFNKLLHELGIQRKVGRQWVLYSKFIANGYVQSATEPMKNSRAGRSYTYSRWTQKGRIFLYNELKNRGVLPLIEQTA